MNRADNSSRDVVRDVLAATDIVDLIGTYLELRPSGSARFKALCPFHNEETPSFMVSRDRQSYHCFGCDRGGDAISFLREHDGMSFREALEKLADRAGIRLPAFGGGAAADEHRKQLLDLGRFAAKFFRGLLTASAGKAGRDYLDSRALKPETIKDFGVGYVPEGWNALRDAARKAGFAEALLEKSGLAKRGDKGSLYDLFRNRVVFPIKDVSGNVVAFGGRDLGDSPAKYINSPENPVYRKSRVLYGLHEARKGMKKAGEAILVEGYFDLLRCFDAGIDNVVATCGTALTAEQAALIKRYVPRVTVVFDGDAAGVKAAARGVGILIGAGLQVKPLILPEGKDPDDFIRDEGRDAFEKLAEEAGDFIAFYVQANAERSHTIEGRTEVAAELFEILSHIQDGLRRDEYLKRVAAELGLNADRCRDEYARHVSRKARRRPVADTGETPAPKIGYEDRIFLASLLAHEELLASLSAVLKQNELPESPLKEVLNALVRAEPRTVLQELESDDARQLYAAAANSEDTWGKESESRVRDRIVSFRKEALKRQARDLQEAIELAQRAREQDRVDKLVMEKVALEKEIRELGAA